MGTANATDRAFGHWMQPPDRLDVPRGTSAEQGGLCSTWNILGNEALPYRFCKDGQTALQGIHQGICPGPPQRWDHGARLFRPAGASEKHEDPADSDKRLEAGQNSLFEPHRPNRHNVGNFVKLWAGEEFFVSGGLYGGVRESQVSYGFPEERRLSGLGFDHAELTPRNREFHRDSRGAATGPDVHLSDSGRLREVACSGERLEEQPVDRLVGILESREVHLPVPAG